MVLASRIRHVRDKRLALTQKELADKLGVDAITVSRWERGIVEPRPRHIRMLADLADMPIAWFFGEETVTAA